jgi:hypothetical protein
VLELLKAEQTISQLAAEYKVHPNVRPDWRTVALQHLASLFDKRDHGASFRASHQPHLQALYAPSGRLTTQLTWIKTIWP